VKTGADGKFSFGELKSGKYELSVSSGLGGFWSRIEVARPKKKCRHGLAIFMVAMMPESCGNHAVNQ
jgi:hypothetical protein